MDSKFIAKKQLIYFFRNILKFSKILRRPMGLRPRAPYIAAHPKAATFPARADRSILKHNYEFGFHN